MRCDTLYMSMVIVISETICISFHLIFPCVLYYIKLLPGMCQLIVTLAIVILLACTFAICNKILPTCLLVVSDRSQLRDRQRSGREQADNLLQRRVL